MRGRRMRGWSRSNTRTQVIGDLFTDKLDLAYRAHNDTFKRHRALRILHPDHR